jgi:hypothetical protein
MIRVLQLFALTASLLTVTGCVIGAEYDYHTLRPQLQRATPSACVIASAVQDQRVEIRTGDKEPDFVGLLRGGYGNPFDVGTASERPLAEDLSGVVGQALTRAGYRVHTVPLAPHVTREQAIDKLAQTGASCMLFVDYRSLKSDTFQNTALIYDIEATVTNPAGRPLARARVEGRDNLGGSGWNPKGHAAATVPRAVEKLLQRLLDDPAIVRALHKAGAAPTERKRAVSRS